jgi:hypothetical protein
VERNSYGDFGEIGVCGCALIMGDGLEILEKIYVIGRGYP